MKRAERRDTARRIFGVHAVAAALSEQPERIRRLCVANFGRPHPAREILVRDAARAGIRVEEVGPEYFDSLAPGRTSQGVVAELTPFPYASLADVLEGDPAAPALVVLLDGVTDPHNLGSVLRSAAFFGALCVVIPADRSAEVTPTVERVSSGGAASVPVCLETNLSRAIERLKAAGFWVYGAAVDGAEPLPAVDLPTRTAWVLGSEGSGMRRLVRESCDVLVRLDTRSGVQSLNVGVFAGVAMYAYALRHGAAPEPAAAPEP